MLAQVLGIVTALVNVWNKIEKGSRNKLTRTDRTRPVLYKTVFECFKVFTSEA